MLLVVTGLSGCFGSPATSDPCDGIERGDVPISSIAHSAVAIATSEGCIVIELYDGEVPDTARNFRTYVSEGFYTDLLWKPIQPGFISQTGGYRHDGSDKVPTHPPIPNEKGKAITAGLHHDLYTLGMAYIPGQPDSAQAQFFINMGRGDHGRENRASADPRNATAAGGFCVFGIVVSGFQAADLINNNTSTVNPQVLVSARVLD
jgi:cyclophilin family peptidyl-prolyl cis-trans isomerase